MRRIIAFGLVAGIFAPVATIRAHHAFASEFDATQPVKLAGTVSKVEWINPHIWIHIEVKGADGKAEEWMIEAGTPNTLMRRGLTTNTLKPGTEVVVSGFRAKDGALRANGETLTYPDGRRVPLSNPGAGGAPAPPVENK